MLKKSIETKFYWQHKIFIFSRSDLSALSRHTLVALPVSYYLRPITECQVAFPISYYLLPIRECQEALPVSYYLLPIRECQEALPVSQYLLPITCAR